MNETLIFILTFLWSHHKLSDYPDCENISVKLRFEYPLFKLVVVKITCKIGKCDAFSAELWVMY